MTEPLKITAQLEGAIALPNGALQFDALLTAAIAMRDNIPTPASASELREIDIPIARSACGRYYLASASYVQVEAYEKRFVNRRMPVEEYQWLGDRKTRSLNLSAGPTKHHRIPRETMHLRGDRVQFWCLGEAERIGQLLTQVMHLGQRRAVGLGRVRAWTVEPCEVWPGFPVLSADGDAMRNLPLDHAGLKTFEQARERLLPPYWMHHGRVECAVPVRS